MKNIHIKLLRINDLQLYFEGRQNTSEKPVNWSSARVHNIWTYVRCSNLETAFPRTKAGMAFRNFFPGSGITNTTPL
jgi:hypothetical protein